MTQDKENIRVKRMVKDDGRSSNVHMSSRRIWAVLLGVVLIVVVILASLTVYYYNLSKMNEGNVDGAAYEVAFQFRLSTYQISSTLQMYPTLDNIASLLITLDQRLQTAWNMVRTLRMYLLTDYRTQMLTVENLLENMTVEGYGGVYETLSRLLGSNNALLIRAYKELNVNASQKITDMGTELSDAFWERIGGNNYTVLEFRVDPSKIENATNICNDLRGILNKWETKYSLP
jgi:hypothetical protein